MTYTRIQIYIISKKQKLGILTVFLHWLLDRQDSYFFKVVVRIKALASTNTFDNRPRIRRVPRARQGGDQYAFGSHRLAGPVQETSARDKGDERIVRTRPVFDASLCLKIGNFKP